MNLHAFLWYAAALAASSYAVRRGGQPEQVIAMLVLIASIATTLLPGDVPARFMSVVWPLVAIDLVLLGGALAVALSADRYWPLYFAATHLLAVGLHGVRAYDPELLPVVYARLGGQLGYPTLLILAVGTWRHTRRGRETDWSWQVPRSA